MTSSGGPGHRDHPQARVQGGTSQHRRPDSTQIRRAHKKRDQQEEGPLTQILHALLDATPLSLGAALVDALGETVDYSGAIDPFDVKVAAAHLQIILTELRAIEPLSGITEFRIHARRRAYLLRALDAEYSLLLVLHRHAAFAVSPRALDEASIHLAMEAGLEPRKVATLWHRVAVETTSTRRPIRLRRFGLHLPERRVITKSKPDDFFGVAPAPADPSTWSELEVIGTIAGLATRERGYRVRLASGAEMNLVRERHGVWFVDERV
ncbi:MAG: hypothetical protein U0414_33345 [Polyangiaceae bacterium]